MFGWKNKHKIQFKFTHDYKNEKSRPITTYVRICRIWTKRDQVSKSAFDFDIVKVIFEYPPFKTKNGFVISLFRIHIWFHMNNLWQKMFFASSLFKSTQFVLTNNWFEWVIFKTNDFLFFLYLSWRYFVVFYQVEAKCGHLRINSKRNKQKKTAIICSVGADHGKDKK